jgi:UDP-GlcNAc:undecaprenyl-phosphate GlcNAc-1-phosphate transferase
VSAAGAIAWATIFGAALSLALTPVAILVARSLSVVDRPAAIKAHRVATPLLGGTAVALAALGSWLLLSAAHVARGSDLIAVWCGAAVVLVVGTIDDVRGLAPWSKLGWQVVALLVSAGVSALTGEPSQADWSRAAATAAVTLAWGVAVINAFNLIDNMNGLCAGTAAVVLAWLCALAFTAGAEPSAILCAALAGACVGFLPYNWPKGRIFLGDAGSMFLGFTVAVLPIYAALRAGDRDLGSVLSIAAIVIAVPLLDMGIVIALRARDRKPFWIGDLRHWSHRLVRRGLRPAPAVALLWTLSAVCGAVAYRMQSATVSEGAALFIALSIGLALVLLATGSQGRAPRPGDRS